jgi:hypothetical protein
LFRPAARPVEAGFSYPSFAIFNPPVALRTAKPFEPKPKRMDKLLIHVFKHAEKNRIPALQIDT